MPGPRCDAALSDIIFAAHLGAGRVERPVRQLDCGGRHNRRLHRPTTGDTAPSRLAPPGPTWAVLHPAVADGLLGHSGARLSSWRRSSEWWSRTSFTSRGGTVLVGDLPTDSVFRSGEIVRVLRKNAPVLTSSAYVELHTRRGKTGLSLSAFDADVQPGDVVEAV